MAALLLVITFVGSAVVCHVVAKRRGARPIFWGVMGALLGPFAIPLVLFSRPPKS